MFKPKTVFSKYQQQELESAFVSNPYLEKDRREALAFTLGLTEYQVTIWFQNRRARKKQKLQ
jgi:homeobox protein EMX